MAHYSIVDYIGSNVSRCGYCKQSECSKSNGMWAHSLSVQDYQDLIDRGWRRSGKYCYKPIMHETCCVLYTIKCAAMDLQLSKSQKKIIKNVNKYLSNGYKEKKVENEDEHTFACGDQISLDSRPNLLLSDNLEQINDSYTNNEIEEVASSTIDVSKSSINNKSGEGSIKSVKIGLGPDLSKPPCKKAKLLRLERRNAKLSEKGLPVETKSQSKVIDKSIEDLINDLPENALHKLECHLLQIKSKRFVETLNSSYELYAKYQMIIHGDSASDCDFSNYEEFLCDSPLKPCGDYGSYHQQYYLDGKLIAVGVIDILPSCVSSVYFYYDPDFGHMSLGTYGALRELMLTRQLHEMYSDLKYYYMGYYINNCPKMRYKAKLRPSFLLCPVAYTWHSIEKCLPKIEATPYARFSDEGQHDQNVCSEDDLDKIRILCESTVIPYQIYRRRKRKSSDSEQIQEYASLVGKHVSRRILLNRH